MGLSHLAYDARRRSRPLVASAALAFSCLTLAPSLAYADEQAAETLFQEGLAAMKRNDYAVACEAFLQSNRADASPGTQINLAVCYEKQKKWASAWTWYRSAVGAAQQKGQKEREQLADESANRLRGQIHHIVVAVKEPLTDLVVKRDGTEVTIAVAGKEVPLAIDPGEHNIEVNARGKKPWAKVIQVPDNAITERIDVPKLEAAPVDDRQTAGPGTEYRPPVIVTNDGSGQRTVGIIVGGTGILFALAAVGVLVVAKGEESDRDKVRAQQLAAEKRGAPPLEIGELKKSADSHAKAADNNQLISIIFGAGAVVLVGVGAFLFFTAPKSPKTGSTRLLPVVGPGMAGLGLGGTF